MNPNDLARNMMRQCAAMQADVPDCHFYVLLDQSALPDLRHTPCNIAALPHANILHDDSRRQLDQASPLLIPLVAQTNQHMQDCLAWLCEQGRWANALSMLTSTLTFADMRAALHARTQAVLPDGVAVILRYFDTRMLPVLWQSLDEDQQRAFASCAMAWHYANREGALCQLPLADEPARRDCFDAPLVLSEAQQNRLLEASEIDAVIALLGEQGIASELTSPPERFRTISPLVRIAQGFGISDIPAITAFTNIGLALGTNFYHEAPWPDLLAKVQQGRLSFFDALPHVSQ